MAYSLGNDPRAHIRSDYLKANCAAYWLGTVHEWRVEDAQLFEKAKRAVETVALQSFEESRVTRLPLDERNRLADDIRALGGYAEPDYGDGTTPSATRTYPVSYRFHFDGEEAASRGFSVVQRAMRAPKDVIVRVATAIAAGKFVDSDVDVEQLQRSIAGNNLNRADALAALDAIEPPSANQASYLRDLVEQGRANERSIGVSFRKNPDLWNTVTRAQANTYIDLAEKIVQPFMKQILIGYLERELVREDTVGRDLNTHPIDLGTITHDEAAEIVQAVRDWLDSNNLRETNENLDIQTTDPDTSAAAEDALRFERLLTHFESTGTRDRDGRIVPGSRNQDIRRSFEQGHHPRLENHEYNDSEIFELRQRHEISQELREYNEMLYGGDAQLIEHPKDALIVGRVVGNNYRFVGIDMTTDEQRPRLYLHDKYDSRIRTDHEIDVDMTLVIGRNDDGKTFGMVTDIEDFGAARSAYRLAYDPSFQRSSADAAVKAYTESWPECHVIDGLPPGISAGRAFYANGGFVALDLTERARAIPTVMLVDMKEVRMGLPLNEDPHDLGILAFDCTFSDEGIRRVYGSLIEADDIETARLEMRATRAMGKVLNDGSDLRRAPFIGEAQGICVATERTKVALFNGRDTYTMVAKTLLDNPNVVVGQYAKTTLANLATEPHSQQQEHSVRKAAGRR